ncbi:hypothetical protein [Archangium violaceum]|uniref:Uncharacterized protein n=1 Tax=Archangium violaceum Cb vi76 TaxID=1406225 RepID=A0A084SZ74_9BACT|nr:hypothetical protein [Archangium violaceum]KFA93759.1 hypothetical protein Q664_07085 [Archangium violaceum Cb vi76]
MKLDPFTDALVRLVHCYYPPGIEDYDPRYKKSEEYQRLTRLLLANQRVSPTWKGFTAKVVEAFPGCHIWDATVPMHEPCNIVRVSLPGFVEGAPRYDSVVVLRSQLAPVYALYASHYENRSAGGSSWWRFAPFPSEYQAHEAKLATLIESTLGFTRLSPESLLIPVPGLVPNTGNLALGRARLVDCLLSPHLW